MSFAQRSFVLLTACTLYLCVCGQQAVASVPFESRIACMHNPMMEPQQHIELVVEIAASNKQRARGLMERDSVADNAGMIFIYPSTGLRSFWMYRTRIPLDIAFINAEGVVMETQQMQPCQERSASRCPTYSPQAPYKMALEMAAGRFSALNIQAGSQFSLGGCKSMSEAFL